MDTNIHLGLSHKKACKNWNKRERWEEHLEPVNCLRYSNPNLDVQALNGWYPARRKQESSSFYKPLVRWNKPTYIKKINISNHENIMVNGIGQA